MTIGNVAGPMRASSFGSFMVAVVKEKEKSRLEVQTGTTQIELNSNWVTAEITLPRANLTGGGAGFDWASFSSLFHVTPRNFGFRLLGTFPETMDQGHYNCRDYYITPHFSATTIVSESPRQPLERHESFQELEERARSPASQKPKFPLLQLPFELRQHILRYLLPHTKEFKDSGLLGEHARNFSAVKKRGARGMFIPSGSSSATPSSVSSVVWQRGNINLLCVCKQLHDEVSSLRAASADCFN
jgi:hypothetical protein